MTKKTRIPKVSVRPTSFIGAGGAGRDVARLTRVRYVNAICELLSLRDERRDEVLASLNRLLPDVYFDSDEWDEVLFQPRFSSRSPEAVTPPANYSQFDSPSGKYIIENVKRPPFRHFEGWVRLGDIENKAREAEAEGNRLYGSVNAQANVVEVGDRLEGGIDQMRTIIGGDIWQSLVGYGLPVKENPLVIELCCSLSGGQGTGVLLVLLGLIAKLVENDRERFRINLNLLLPGFFKVQNELDVHDQRMKALSVFRDLSALKIEGRPLEILHPDGKIILTSRHTSELFSQIFIYQPDAVDKDRYQSFVSRTSQTIINAEVSAVASDLRRARSNALELARRTL